MQRNVQSARRDTTNLLVEQILFSSHVMLTKVDRVGSDRIQSLAQSIHGLNPLVPVMSLPWGNLPVDDILAMPDYDYHRVAQLIDELAPCLEAEADEEAEWAYVWCMLTSGACILRGVGAQGLWRMH